MKLTKTTTKEVITEEIQIEDGTYYFTRGMEPFEYYKVTIEDSIDDYCDLTVEKVRDIYNAYLITYESDYTDFLENVLQSYFKKEKYYDEYLNDSNSKEFSQAKKRVLEIISRK